MRPTKTDCIIEISIKKYVGKEKQKLDTRNKRTNTGRYLIANTIELIGN